MSGYAALLAKTSRAQWSSKFTSYWVKEFESPEESWACRRAFSQTTSAVPAQMLRTSKPADSAFGDGNNRAQMPRCEKAANVAFWPIATFGTVRDL
jgi:hypothetical protein